jgi:hypothetical protein
LTIDVSAELHLRGACLLTIGVEGSGEFFQRVFFDDYPNDVISGNSENMLFNPGVPISAGKLLIIKITNLNYSSQCKYTVLLNYMFVP